MYKTCLSLSFGNKVPLRAFPCMYACMATPSKHENECRNIDVLPYRAHMQFLCPLKYVINDKIIILLDL